LETSGVCFVNGVISPRCPQAVEEYLEKDVGSREKAREKGLHTHKSACQREIGQTTKNLYVNRVSTYEIIKWKRCCVDCAFVICNRNLRTKLARCKKCTILRASPMSPLPHTHPHLPCVHVCAQVRVRAQDSHPALPGHAVSAIHTYVWAAVADTGVALPVLTLNPKPGWHRRCGATLGCGCS